MTYVFTDINVSVEHLSPDSNNSNKEGYLSDAALASISCNIQPSSMEVLALYGGAAGKMFSMYTTSSGILETDRVTVSGINDKYIVKGKEKFTYSTLQYSHYILELIL